MIDQERVKRNSLETNMLYDRRPKDTATPKFRLKPISCPILNLMHLIVGEGLGIEKVMDPVAG